jgi:pyrroline-5-carboxylate reductase
MTSTTFIGAGNISQALIGGYLKTGQADRIVASDPVSAQLDKLPAEVVRTNDNIQAIADSQTVVLCLKPGMMSKICQTLRGQTDDKLFISVAAGITIESLNNWLGEDTAVIRCMPNTPALVQQGMTGLFANTRVTDSQRNIAENILGSVGKVLWFSTESALDTVTAISGSGPAYYFLVMESMQQAGIGLGLTADESRVLVLQTALGAAQMAIDSDLTTEQLRINVTSHGGTTQAALTKLMGAGLTELFAEAIEAAFERSKELSRA